MVNRTHVTSLRLSLDEAEEVALVARIEGITFTQFIRDAIAAHLQARGGSGYANRSRPIRRFSTG